MNLRSPILGSKVNEVESKDYLTITCHNTESYLRFNEIESVFMKQLSSILKLLYIV